MHMWKWKIEREPLYAMQCSRSPSSSLSGISSSGLLKLKMSITSLSQHVLGHAQLRPNVMMCIQRMIHGQFKSSLQSDFVF